MKQSEFRTVETSEEILRELYARNPDKVLFKLTLIVVVPSADCVEDMPMNIFVERLGDTPEVYQHPNGALVFETRAYVEEENGRPFSISITPPIGNFRMDGASVSASPEMNDVIGEYLVRIGLA